MSRAPEAWDAFRPGSVSSRGSVVVVHNRRFCRDAAMPYALALFVHIPADPAGDTGAG
jgi:hypothetical protein